MLNQVGMFSFTGLNKVYCPSFLLKALGKANAAWPGVATMCVAAKCLFNDCVAILVSRHMMYLCCTDSEMCLQKQCKVMTDKW